MTNRPDTSRRIRGRRGRWIVAIGLGGVVLGMLVLMAPTIVARTPLRHWALEAAMPRFKNRARCGSASLNWFAPVVFEEVELLGPDRRRLITIAAIRTRRPLWQLLWDLRRPGPVEIINPRAELMRSEHAGEGNSAPSGFPLLAGTPADDSGTAASPPRRLPADVLVALRDGYITMRDTHGRLRWHLGPLNIEAGVRTAAGMAESPGSVPEIFVHESQLADRMELSPEICDDLLAMAAPMLAGVARAEGEFSLHIDSGSVRLIDPPQGKIGGQLTIHRATLGGGSIASQLISALDLPSSARLIEQSIVRFYWDGQRVWHDNFELRIGTIALRTSGSVGTDRSLDLTVEIVLPSLQEDRPVLRRLQEQGLLRFPVRGTLDEPRLDVEVLADRGIDLLQELLDSVLSNRPLAGDLLERLEQGDWLQRWRRARQSGASGTRRRLFPHRLQGRHRGTRQMPDAAAPANKERTTQRPSSNRSGQSGDADTQATGDDNTLHIPPRKGRRDAEVPAPRLRPSNRRRRPLRNLSPATSASDAL